jgi:hypothetical protein
VVRALVSSHVGWARANVWSGDGELGALGWGWESEGEASFLGVFVFGWLGVGGD